MSHELICGWLGLPAESWPPDHYRLLGLEPGEADPELIERRVHERLDLVRRYQMMHPEQATEAMNRVAQAYICLTESAAKREYDAALSGGAAPDQALAAAATARAAQAQDGTPDPLAWLFGPALSLAPSPTATPPPLPRLPPLPPPAPTRTLTPADTEPPEYVDTVIAAAQQSGPARRGLDTKRALYRRVVTTRKLLHLWDQLGTYLKSPKRRLSRSADGPELSLLLSELIVLLRRFPRLMGGADQPGYLVFVLARQEEDVVKSIQTYDAGQREALSSHWEAGRKLLTAHRDFLRRQIHAMRKWTPGERLLRAGYALVTDKIFLLLLLLALNLALWRDYVWQLWRLFQGNR